MQRLHVVSATREDPVGFSRHTKLGLSLARLSFDRRITVSMPCRNTDGLSSVYNWGIERAADDDVLLFVHDDVYIDDIHVLHRLAEAHRHFDVVGLAGNTNPHEHHVAWLFWRDPGTTQVHRHDPAVLSGAVSHFTAKGEIVSYYGPTPQECVLLDGCFLSVPARTIRERRLRFDPRFTFHFYDLDFCRTCRAAGLRLGTWPIAVTHASGGSFGTPQWEAALKVYQEKWAR
jgi:GT2 family glycosyltransferase